MGEVCLSMYGIYYVGSELSLCRTYKNLIDEECSKNFESDSIFKILHCILRIVLRYSVLPYSSCLNKYLYKHVQ